MLSPTIYKATRSVCPIFLKIVGALFVLCQSATAYAEFHATLSGTTNYVYRMYTKSNGGPALQGNLDYQHSSGFYSGMSISSFNIGPSELDLKKVFPNSAQVEFMPYIGWNFNIADDWRFDLQYSRYFYDREIYSQNGEYNEFYAFLHYKDLLTASISFSEEFYNTPGYALFYELTARYPLTDYLEFSSTGGYAYTRENIMSDFPYWNVGLTGHYKFVSLDLRYHDSTEIPIYPDDPAKPMPDYPKTLKASVVFTVSVGF